MSTIKLSRIIFEGAIQINGMSFREYSPAPNAPAGYEAHLHGDLQCISMRATDSDTTLYVPLRLVRSMEAADKHTVSASSDTEPLAASSSREGPSDYAEPSDEFPRRRGRPRTKHLGSSGDTI